MLVADRQSLDRKIALAHELARPRSARSLSAFLDHLVINSSPPSRFSLVREPWQAEVIGPMVPAHEHVAGATPHHDGPTSCRGLRRGHNKTSLVADLSGSLPWQVFGGSYVGTIFPTKPPRIPFHAWVSVPSPSIENIPETINILRLRDHSSPLILSLMRLTTIHCYLAAGSPGGTGVADPASLNALRR